MASQSSSPNVSGPLAGMFTTAAQQAIIAEEAADLLTQEQNIERATIAAAAATAAAAAETEATASALLGSVGLPVQQEFRLCRALRYDRLGLRPGLDAVLAN